MATNASQDIKMRNSFKINDCESMARQTVHFPHQNNDNLKYFAGCCFTSATKVSNSERSLSARV
jgi:hypothetical protein